MFHHWPGPLNSAPCLPLADAVTVSLQACLEPASSCTWSSGLSAYAGWLCYDPRTCSPPSQQCPAQPPQDEVGVRLTQEDPGAADWRAMNLLTLYFSTPRYL